METHRVRQFCGCVYEHTIDNSEDFDGYDSDRESEKFHYCELHKNKLTTLSNRLHDIHKTINALNDEERDIIRQLNDIQKTIKQIQ